jgi:hypothetical protein
VITVLGLQWCHSGVTVVLQWCYSGVTVVLQWCYSGVPVVVHISRYTSQALYRCRGPFLSAVCYVVSIL